jgi:hypothetical protein
VSAYPVILVAVPVEHLSPTEGLSAEAWSGCAQQHIPSCKGGLHDISSATVDRYAECGITSMLPDLPQRFCYERGET